MVKLLLFASVERFGVSRMRVFHHVLEIFNFWKQKNSIGWPRVKNWPR